MSTEKVFVQQFAKLFVHYREALTLNHDSPAGERAVQWQELPSVERERLVAAARLALMDIENTTSAESDRSRYFAKPGSAEWGC
jgi:hypothetical protein